MTESATKILLVEDEDGHVDLVRRAFQYASSRFDLTTVNSLSQACQSLSLSQPDLVLADFILPDGHGIELLSWESVNGRIPVLMMTSHGSEQVAVEVMKAGAVDYIVKSAETLSDMPHLVQRTLREWRHINEKKEAEQALRESREQLSSILNAMTDVVWSMCARTMKTVHLNPAAQALYGRPIAYLMETPGCWKQLIHPEDLPLVDNSISQLLEKGAWEGEYRIVRPSGEPRWVFDRAICVRDALDQPVRFDCLLTDISERKEAEAALLKAKEAAETAQRELEVANRQLVHLSRTDGLTGLHNRSYFMERLSTEFHRARRYNHLLSMLMLDIDHFKKVNDEQGHLAGDQVLAAVAREIAAMVRQSDVAGRVGGEEFCILLAETDPLGARTFAERVRRQVAAATHHSSDGTVFPVTCSVGIACLDDRITSTTDFLRAADAALYMAKAEGRDRVGVYTPSCSLRRRVLVIDDEEPELETLCQYLGVIQPPLDVLSATSGYEGCARFSEKEPDLVILDVQMSEIEGAAVLKSMKATNHGQRAKFLVISALPGRLADLKEMGCDDILCKPFDAPELVGKVKSLLEN
jgi:two-component system, cell cycle response regulator